MGYHILKRHSHIQSHKLNYCRVVHNTKLNQSLFRLVYLSLRIHELTFVKISGNIYGASCIALSDPLLRVFYTFAHVFSIFCSTMYTAYVYMSVNNYRPLLHVITVVIE